MSVHFGWDQAAPFSADTLAHVTAAYGKAHFIGRYLEQIQGTSTGLTVAEVAATHAAGLALCLCYNGASPADVAASETVGANNAAVAVKHAQALGAPNGTAIFVDIEAQWYPSAAFLKGWISGTHNGGYAPGAYCNAQETSHTAPIIAASAATGIPLALWSSEPELYAWINQAVTEWYDFSQTPLGAAHAGLVVLHQTGENEQGGSVDLDIASDAGMTLLWGTTPQSPTPTLHHVTVPGDLKAQAGHTSPSVPDPAHPASGYNLPVGTQVTYIGGTQTVAGEVWRHISVTKPLAVGYFLAKSMV